MTWSMYTEMITPEAVLYKFISCLLQLCHFQSLKNTLVFENMHEILMPLVFKSFTAFYFICT